MFTHEHRDHFWLEAVLEALERNPRLLIISGREVSRKIREREKDAVLCEIAPEEKKTVRIRFPREDTELCFFNSPHMGEAYQEIQNLACLAEIQRKKTFYSGRCKTGWRAFQACGRLVGGNRLPCCPVSPRRSSVCKKGAFRSSQNPADYGAPSSASRVRSPGLGWKRAARLQSDTGRSSQSSVCFWRGNRAAAVEILGQKKKRQGANLKRYGKAGEKPLDTGVFRYYNTIVCADIQSICV